MDNKQAIENIKKLKECATTYRNTVADTPQKEVSVVIGDKQLFLNDEMLQALDLAIESLHHFDYQDLFNKTKKAYEELIKMLVDNGIIELEDKA